MVIEKQIHIKRNIDQAWQVLGVEFSQASRWASAVNHSAPGGPVNESGQCTERACETTMGKLREKLYQYAPENYQLAYEVAEGLPSMVAHASNSWQLQATGIDSCMLLIRMEFRLRGMLGKMMALMMKMQLSRMGNHLVEDFAFYVEHGQPHPRKVKQMKKQAA